MSKMLSLKLQDEVFHEAEEIVKESGGSRNAYFNEAINFYNKLCQRKRLKDALIAESAWVAAESLKVLEVFEQMEDGLDE